MMTREEAVKAAEITKAQVVMRSCWNCNGAPSAEKLLIVLKEFSKQQNSSTHFSIQTKY